MDPPVRRYTISLAALAMAAAPLLLRQARGQTTGEFAGYVFDAEGSWRTASQANSDLVVGQGLRNGEIVTLRTFTRDARIQIGLINQAVIGRDCTKDKAGCAQSFEVNVPGPDASWTARFWSIWQRLTAPPSKTMLFTESRGPAGRSASFKDAIAPLRSGKPDLAPALGATQPGKLAVTLEPIEGQGRISLNVDWKQPRATTSGPVVRAGLYLLRLASDSTGQPAMILVALPDQAKVFAKDLEESRRFCAGWDEDLQHTYLASVLGALAKEIPGGRH